MIGAGTGTGGDCASGDSTGAVGTRVWIITGHYGSGKSEFALNFALKMRAQGAELALCDIDVVNPYFRSRERRGLLEAQGIHVVGNNLAVDEGIDLPAVSAELYGPLADPAVHTVIDVGGDPVGARLLRSFRRLIPAAETEVLCVVNAMRPATQSADALVAQIQGIEAASGLAVTGLINTTHLLEYTTVEHIQLGNDLCIEVGQRTGLPVRFVGAREHLVLSLPEEIQGERVGVAMHLRDNWMFAGKELGHGTN